MSMSICTLTHPHPHPHTHAHRYISTNTNSSTYIYASDANTCLVKGRINQWKGQLYNIKNLYFNNINVSHDTKIYKTISLLRDQEIYYNLLPSIT